MDFLTAVQEFRFLQIAVVASLLASLASGLVGTYVVVKKIGYLAGGVAHAVLGGVGVALFLGHTPMFGALLAALVAALLLGGVKLYWREQEDVMVGALWAMGMSIGVIFITKTPGHQVELMTYLFGNILLVSDAQLWVMLGLDAVLIVLITVYYKQFEAIVFDQEFAKLRGLPVTALYLTLMCLVAVSVVLLVQAVGLILVIALLTIPAAIAQQYVYNLISIMMIASGLAAFFCLFGLFLSYSADLPTGATMILVAVAAYFVSIPVKRAIG